jgi:hypothetical protein
MKRTISLSLALLMLGVFSLLTLDHSYAQEAKKQNGKTYTEQYGPRDDDGDGIPNGQDPDYVKPKDGTGKKFGQANKNKTAMNGKVHSYGAGNGGKNGIGPKDGTGNGKKTGVGTGTCDGTGPKGKGR